jgi:hypothetical protein
MAEEVVLEMIPTNMGATIEQTKSIRRMEVFNAVKIS